MDFWVTVIEGLGLERHGRGRSTCGRNGLHTVPMKVPIGDRLVTPVLRIQTILESRPGCVACHDGQVESSLKVIYMNAKLPRRVTFQTEKRVLVRLTGTDHGP
jgi:hypothetical protein